MFADGKRFRPSPVFDEASYPVPKTLKRSLELISGSFNMNSMRNIHIMETSNDSKLYGFITTYESDNFCWIQPTRTLERYIKDEYHTYIVRINSDARHDRLGILHESKLHMGMDILAQYEADNRWYRAMIVGEPIDRAWLVIFIDYGNYQRCTVSKMAEIILEKDCNHYHAPMQAVCCRLYNIVPRLPQHRQQIDIALEKFYSDHSSTFLELLVRNIRRDFVVDCDVFFCKAGTNNERRFFRKNIAQSLVDQQLAIFADPKAAYSIMPTSESSLSAELVTLGESDEEEETLKRKINLKMENEQKQKQAEHNNATSSGNSFVDQKQWSKMSIKVKLEQPGNLQDNSNKETPISRKRGFDGSPKYINKPLVVNGVEFRPFG